MDVEFNTYMERGGMFTNWKSGRRAIRVQIFKLAFTGIKLGKYQLQVF